eukprot:TRINITY_DN23139_c0_g1_i1.p1 TRINITY_DN23139_c0_g1~~TRINITY_DN23139_c0_g1_i1.p1  ORF type:complete len:178 (-),score=12.23 TRINITY_DN23139_c0_g1_i1:220-753(-)
MRFECKHEKQEKADARPGHHQRPDSVTSLESFVGTEGDREGRYQCCTTGSDGHPHAQCRIGGYEDAQGGEGKPVDEHDCEHTPWPVEQLKQQDEQWKCKITCVVQRCQRPPSCVLGELVRIVLGLLNAICTYGEWETDNRSRDAGVADARLDERRLRIASQVPCDKEGIHVDSEAEE